MGRWSAKSWLALAGFVGAAVLWGCMPTPMPTRDLALGVRLEAGLGRGYPGVAAVVQHGAAGQVHWAAVGFADLEQQHLLKIDDGFHVGSITKTFTAVAVLRLVDQGRLSLDATLASLLGTAVARVPNAQAITVRQLLDHSSGVYPTNNDLAYLETVIGARADPTRVWSLAEYVALADRDRRPPTHAPGAAHSYSDTNYVLLAMIVERVTGEPFRRHVQRTIFAPLKMRATYFLSDYAAPGAELPHRRVQGYMLETAEIRRVIAVHPMFAPVPGAKAAAGERLLNTTLAAERSDAAGGVMSTLPDLVRYADALFRGRLLSPASQRVLMAVDEAACDTAVGKHVTRTLQGMRKPYGVLVYKEGDGPGGTTAVMAYLPERDAIFIGFVNRFGGSFDHVDFLLDDVFEQTLRSADAR